MPKGDFGKFRIKPDENLAKITGNEPLKPNEMIKKIWEYIRANKLASS